MATNPTNLSGRYNITDANKIITLGAYSRERRGCIWNRGNNTIFIAFNKETVSSTDVNAEVIDEDYLLAGESMRLPAKTESLTIKCATGLSSKFSYIED